MGSWYRHQRGSWCTVACREGGYGTVAVVRGDGRPPRQEPRLAEAVGSWMMWVGPAGVCSERQAEAGGKGGDSGRVRVAPTAVASSRVYCMCR